MNVVRPASAVPNRRVAWGVAMGILTPLTIVPLSPAAPSENASLQDPAPSIEPQANDADVYGPPIPDQARAPKPPAISPQLELAGELAMKQYPSLSAARSAVRASELDTSAARWLRGPSVAVSAVTRDDKIGAVRPQVEVFQPIWTGGRIEATIDRAKAANGVSRAELQQTANEVLLRLASAYYNVVRGVRLEGVLEQSLSEHDRLVDSMDRRVKQEVSPRSDLDLARSRAAQVRQELSLARAQRYAALQQLRELVGDPAFEVAPLPQYDGALHHPNPDGLVARTLECDPAIQRRQAAAEVAEADRRLARSALYPSVGLQYTYDRFAGSVAGIAVQAQTNGGLSPLAAAQASSARRQASLFEISVAEREAREQTVLDLVENTTTKARIESSRIAVESSANVTDSFMRQFITGRRTWLDVMNAVREANSARISLIEAENSAMASAARLLIRSCQWQPWDRSIESPS
jgi:adhesin transport system outer membrane protein